MEEKEKATKPATKPGTKTVTSTAKWGSGGRDKSKKTVKVF
jgi:hypothetical protein